MVRVGEQGGSCVWGKSGGCEVGKGGAESQGAGVRWLDGRKRAGPVLHVCRAPARARGWLGRLGKPDGYRRRPPVSFLKQFFLFLRL